MEEWLPYKGMRRREFSDQKPELWARMTRLGLAEVTVRLDVLLAILNDIGSSSLGRKPCSIANSLGFKSGKDMAVEIGKLRKFSLIMQSDDFERYKLTEEAKTKTFPERLQYIIKNVYGEIPPKYFMP